MKDRPILFSGPMVRAILDGRKTMTRRVITPQPEMEMDGEILPDGTGGYGWGPVLPPWPKWPYQIGDRLWVRETWATRDPIWDDDKAVSFMIPATVDPGMIVYRADGEKDRKWRPSIHMPRWASRITLEIVNIRVERLREITEEDAEKEGANSEFECDVTTFCGGGKIPESTYKLGFKHLWDSINDKTYPWSSNPWVWVIEFKRIKEANDA